MLFALTTSGHTLIWVGGEEGGVIRADATLQLHICHATELIDGKDEFMVVPVETTAWCVTATH